LLQSATDFSNSGALLSHPIEDLAYYTGLLSDDLKAGLSATVLLVNIAIAIRGRR
jgi:hypothetical protein